MQSLPTNSFEKIQKSDINAFENVFKSLYPQLCSFAYGYIKDKDTVEELVQDVFFILWKDRKKLTIKTSLKSYLYRIVQNKCIRYWQHKKIEDKYKASVQLEKINSIDPQAQLENDELSTILSQTLESLPERCRNIFNMSRIEGLKYYEIAEQLAISIKTVEANMGKALKAFRQSIKQYQ